MSVTEWGFVFSVVTAVSTGLGILFALSNWRLAEKNRTLALRNAHLAERWKRAELAAGYLRPIFEDAECVFALRCIDWAVGRIPIPACHQEMFADIRTIEHDVTMLQLAMTPRLLREVAQSPTGMLYRLAFDTLFGRLEFIGHRVATGLIGIEDVPDIRYYLTLLADWPYAPGGLGPQVFMPFLQASGYHRLLDLMRRFGIEGVPGDQHGSGTAQARRASGRRA